jgi:hypothetical protein
MYQEQTSFISKFKSGQNISNVIILYTIAVITYTQSGKFKSGQNIPNVIILYTTAVWNNKFTKCSHLNTSIQPGKLQTWKTKLAYHHIRIQPEKSSMQLQIWKLEIWKPKLVACCIL